jgi:hypothetical protein
VGNKFDDTFKKFQDELSKTNIFDFEIRLYENYNLLITGSFDFSYYHEVEIIFYNVLYISSLTTNLISYHIRLADEDEINDFRKNNIYLSEDDYLVVLYDEYHRNYIKMQGMEYKFNLVKYYDDNSKYISDQLISDWAKNCMKKEIGKRQMHDLEFNKN